MELRPYQLHAVDAVALEHTRHRATLLVLGTGLGKTVAFGAYSKRIVEAGGKVLVIAHRGELLDQAAGTLARFGLTVAIEQGSQRVDPSQLPDVVIASVQTMRGKRLASFAPNAFALVVIDEAHHATATSYRDVLEHFAPAKVLGVTATPQRADGVGLRTVFASVAYRMELGAGIAGGYLAPIELRSVVVESLDLTKVRTVAGDLAAGDLERELTRDGTLHEVAGPLAELAAGRQTLAFCAGVAQAHALAQVLEGYGVKAAAVDGSMTPEQRATVLADYRSGRVQTVCNAMLWTEGFDAPETACVALVRPTRSRSLLVQMIGRGTRIAEGKGACLVLDFVPGRPGKLRLSSPADALAGSDLPENILALIRALSVKRADNVNALISQATLEQKAIDAAELERVQNAAREQQRAVQRVGVVYAAPRLDVRRLLDAVCDDPPGWRPEWRRKPATERQMQAVRDAGFEVSETLNHREASALLTLVDQRRAAGLCTIKQARRLRSYGLRDDMTFSDAREALDAIASNGWKPPTWLYSDPRFAKAA
jgi:superfamily II DNA or RNA helicase